MDGSWEIVFDEQCFNNIDLLSSNMDMILSSGLLLLSSTEKMKKRPTTENKSKQVALFNVLLLIPKSWSEVLISRKISKTSFDKTTLGVDKNK